MKEKDQQNIFHTNEQLVKRFEGSKSEDIAWNAFWKIYWEQNPNSEIFEGEANTLQQLLEKFLAGELR